MASSNRHWPSMFKSKPHHHQWQQHDINPTPLMSTACSYRIPNYTSGPASDERSPEPKPRWNPKPEQIRILEAIFNSGMVNPPRDEIRKIRAQLQEYGQVGDANVFYWFQNRKSRSKHKLRNLQNSSSKSQQHKITTTAPPTSSSSSSSDKSSHKAAGSSKRSLSSNSPNGSVNQTYNFQQSQNEFVPAEPPFFFPAQQQAGTQGFCFSELSNVVQIQEHHPVVGPCTSLLLNEIMNSSAASKKEHFTNQEKNTPHLGYIMTSSPISHHTNIALAPLHSTSTNDGTVTVASTINQIQGESAGGGPVVVGAGGAVARSSCMVFINDVAIEVAVGPFNVREAFGDDVLLIHSSGHPVVTNEWGVTLHPLQHGAFYYLVPLSITEHI